MAEPRDREPETTTGGGWAGRTVALCVTGSIAAYKAVELARLLVKAGARVLPVMTASASRFVGPVDARRASAASRSRRTCGTPRSPARCTCASPSRRISWRSCPATADMLSRLAHGRADDLVTALALGARGPVLAAPAMHPRMWDHPATQRNVAELAAQGRVTLVGPVRGEVASREEGMGRMAEPADIAAAALGAARRECAGARARPRGLRVVVTAGPTLEDIDPVRFLGNRSSGKMGFAHRRARGRARCARHARRGPGAASPTPPGVRRIDVRGALDMRAALWSALGQDLSGADALIMAAAVADHRPAQVAPSKIKKGDAGASIELVKNPDLLGRGGRRSRGRSGCARGWRRGAAGKRQRRPVLVGFAVETSGGEALVAYARRKLQEKRVDFVVANEAADSFGREDNRVVLVRRRRRGDAAQGLEVRVGKRNSGSRSRLAVMREP